MSVNTYGPDSVALDFIWQAVLMRWLFVLEKENIQNSYHFRPLVELSRKFWSAKNFGPEDQNSWKIGPPDHYFLKILVRAWNYGPSENTLV